MESFREIDADLADVVMKTWHRHEDFLIPEMCFLSLVGSKVPPEEKKLIAKEILSIPAPNEFLLPAKPRPSKPATTITKETRLQDLARTERVHLPFHLLKMDIGFLSKDDWEADPEYQRLKLFVTNFRVVNDCAERACQLASDFKDRMPKDPKQQSEFFSTITQQRRDRSDLSRKALSKAK